ncbi:MAG: hypothetical protein COB15_13900 [Flavobacteriales bacterium]|nr:MAG: hypothetical protein COB15_13900 [Flavobacteriales bacterium]
MKIIKYILFCFIFCFSTSYNLIAQCHTNTNICASGTSGPFTFSTPGPSVSSCLDFWGPGYAYISLYITQSGPLEMLIDGDASSGYLDVAIFNIPSGIDPCLAIQNNSNQISCNYALAASGCNQIGSFFGCPSFVSSPNVNVGDRLMIVVENWSGSSTNFTLDLGPAPAAQSGPGNPSINPVTISLTDASSPYQMTAADNGGVWSGTGVSSSGLFDPSTTGVGTFVLYYNLGSGPCLTTDSIHVIVNAVLAVELIDLQLNCKNDKAIMKWSTASEINCDYFKVERSYDAHYYTTIGVVDGHGNSSAIMNYTFVDDKNKGHSYYRLVEVDYNGKETIYGPLSTKCVEEGISIYPNPVRDYLKVKIPDSEESLVVYEIKSVTGKLIISNTLDGAIDVSNLSSGYYIITIKTDNQQYIQKFVRQ